MVSREMVEAFAAKCDEALRAHMEKTCPSIRPDRVVIDWGRRYAKLVREDHTGKISRSAYAFVDLSNGDVLKAESWARPAKHARGNLLDESGGMKWMGVNGPAYLR